VGQFAQAIVAEEITKKNGSNQFVIQTDKPNVQVSWQVTGVRDDPYARQHRIEPVQEKPSSLKGRYLHPELYGQPAERGMHRPEARRSGKAQPRSSQRKAGRSKRGTTAPAGPQRFPQHQRP
jgi:hypothetical protein